MIAPSTVIALNLVNCMLLVGSAAAIKRSTGEWIPAGCTEHYLVQFSDRMEACKIRKSLLAWLVVSSAAAVISVLATESITLLASRNIGQTSSSLGRFDIALLIAAICFLVLIVCLVKLNSSLKMYRELVAESRMIKGEGAYERSFGEGASRTSTGEALMKEKSLDEKHLVELKIIGGLTGSLDKEINSSEKVKMLAARRRQEIEKEFGGKIEDDPGDFLDIWSSLRQGSKAQKK